MLLLALLAFLLITCARQSVVQLHRRLVACVTHQGKVYKDKPQNDKFLLTEDGQCQFSPNEHRQISPNSQINLWGYWLVFTDSTLASQFIFKDSLSTIDQTRVARTILRVKQYPPL